MNSGGGVCSESRSRYCILVWVIERDFVLKINKKDMVCFFFVFFYDCKFLSNYLLFYTFHDAPPLLTKVSLFDGIFIIKLFLKKVNRKQKF